MLLRELDNLFSDVCYPGDKALADYWPNEWESFFERVKGKNWRNVTANDFVFDAGIDEGIQALSLKGFIYYLPGLVHIALTKSDDRYPVASALLTLFSIPDRDRAPSATNSQRNVILSLSAARRDFLIRFFLKMKQMEPNLSPSLIDSVITILKHK
jgi:hypothetical protein